MILLNKIIICYYLITNLVLFVLMGIDKSRAKNNKWRIPEATLFLVSLIGGAIGGFIGMFKFRHKTKKFYFYLIFGISLILHIIAFLWYSAL